VVGSLGGRRRRGGRLHRSVGADFGIDIVDLGKAPLLRTSGEHRPDQSDQGVADVPGRILRGYPDTALTIPTFLTLTYVFPCEIGDESLSFALLARSAPTAGQETAARLQIILRRSGGSS
jgi:hypothetical protein